MTKEQGFTMIEILIVLAIIGLFLTIGLVNINRSIQASQLREATNQFAADLRRSRALAQRTSKDVTIAWTPDSSSKITRYFVGDTAIDLPYGITMKCESGCGSSANTIVYSAPYGELTGASGSIGGKRFSLSSPNSSVNALSLRIVGVTGKVIIAQGS